jgi:hypothetical protein
MWLVFLISPAARVKAPERRAKRNLMMNSPPNAQHAYDYAARRMVVAREYFARMQAAEQKHPHGAWEGFALTVTALETTRALLKAAQESLKSPTIRLADDREVSRLILEIKRLHDQILEVEYALQYLEA